MPESGGIPTTATPVAAAPSRLFPCLFLSPPFHTFPSTASSFLSSFPSSSSPLSSSSPSSSSPLSSSSPSSSSPLSSSSPSSSSTSSSSSSSSPSSFSSSSSSSSTSSSSFFPLPMTRSTWESLPVGSEKGAFPGRAFLTEALSCVSGKGPLPACRSLRENVTGKHSTDPPLSLLTCSRTFLEAAFSFGCDSKEACTGTCLPTEGPPPLFASSWELRCKKRRSSCILPILPPLPFLRPFPSLHSSLPISLALSLFPSPSASSASPLSKNETRFCRTCCPSDPVVDLFLLLQYHLLPLTPLPALSVSLEDQQDQRASLPALPFPSSPALSIPTLPLLPFLPSPTLPITLSVALPIPATPALPFPAVPAIIPITPSPALPILHICRFIPMLKTCLPLRHLLYGFRPSPHKRTPLPFFPPFILCPTAILAASGGGGNWGRPAAASGAAAPLSSPPPRLSTYPSPLPPCFPSLSPVLSPPSPRLVQQQQQRQ
ncbi:unnamed protein product [Closterium sp. NIES-65]|nr:unnamed protein product [Closterium sp. NIES-65]